MNHSRPKTKTDRHLCGDFLHGGDQAAFKRLTERYTRQIERIAEVRFRRNDMSEDLMAAVCYALNADGNLILTEWYELSEDSIGEIMEKLGAESPLLD